MKLIQARRLRLKIMFEFLDVYALNRARDPRSQQLAVEIVQPD